MTLNIFPNHLTLPPYFSLSLTLDVFGNQIINQNLTTNLDIINHKTKVGIHFLAIKIKYVNSQIQNLTSYNSCKNKKPPTLDPCTIKIRLNPSNFQNQHSLGTST